uniref:Fido domain-containing protein n=1 Tax=Entomoneis paludosa TaxID=265537 RepID=A0A7S3DN49_9STRA
MAGKDWKHEIEEQEMSLRLQGITLSENDIQEALNHILVSEKLQELAQENDFTETVLLQLHSWVMDGLLIRPKEGLPGEYRKVAIGIEGSKRGRAPFEDVPPLMKRFFDKTIVQKKNEHLIEFLARIHGEFQFIHPFRDGNGRLGRIMMNLFLIKNGYPILVLPTSLSTMFNHALEMGHRGECTLFARLLAESTFKSLQIYEEAIGTKLLPSIEEATNFKVADAPGLVSP